MSTVFILAGHRTEAEWIARKAGLLAPRSWREATVENLRGVRYNPVLMTGMHCWRQGMSPMGVGELNGHMGICNLKRVVVPCLDVWEAIGFTLPENWFRPGDWVPPEPEKPRWFRGPWNRGAR